MDFLNQQILKVPLFYSVNWQVSQKLQFCLEEQQPKSFLFLKVKKKTQCKMNSNKLEIILIQDIFQIQNKL